MTPEQSALLLDFMRRQADALESIAERLASGEPLVTSLHDIEQPAIESLTLASRDTR